MDNNTLKPFLKWPGGKSKELKYITPCLPKEINNYYEPFIGGGAVYFSINANKYFINDKSKDLIDLYTSIQSENKIYLFQHLIDINNSWKKISNIFQKNKKNLFDIFIDYRKEILNKENLKNAINKFFISIEYEIKSIFSEEFNFNIDFFLNELNITFIRKIGRMKDIEMKKGELTNEDIELNLETAIKGAFYMYFRYLLNNKNTYEIKKETFASIYYFIRNYTYSGMFRYNANGSFNVPYGGISYNNNNLDNKIEYLQNDSLQKRLKETTIENFDFYDFMLSKKLDNNDFIFLDPPYDTEFSTYDQNDFDKDDQVRLANYLLYIANCNWMLIIKNTPFIHSLYEKEGIYFNYFDKTYAVSFMNRNDKNTEHLLITNYQIDKEKTENYNTENLLFKV